MTVMIDPGHEPGLWTEDENENRRPVPLTKVEVRVDVVGATQTSRLRQTYRNDGDAPVEATYVFPLPAGSAVHEFVARLDGHELRGVVKDSEEAFADYDDAVEEGRGAWLLDANRPDLFTASVGNLLPGSTVEIEIVTVAEVPREGDGLRLVVPQNFTPKYFPMEILDADGRDDAQALDAPRRTGELPYSWDIEVSVDLLGPVAKVSSPTHRIETTFEGSRANVRLAEDEGRPDRDFVLRLEAQSGALAPAGVFRDARGDRFVAASIRPTVADATESAVDVVFLVDCSGSMHGESIADARRAMLVALSALRDGDRFRIVRFGTGYESLTDDLVDHSPQNFDAAKKYIQEMDADLGGTELGGPLSAIAEAAKAAKRSTNLVLITDGATGDDARLVKYAEENRRHLRVFTIGVGPMASEDLVRGLASASGGCAEFVVPGEEIATKVARHFRRLRVQPIEDVRVEFDGIEVTDLHPLLNDRLYPSDIVTLYGRVLRGEAGRLRLYGQWCGEEWTHEVDLEPREDHGAVAKLWARHQCAALERAWLESDVGGRRRNPRSLRRATQQARQALVDFATRYGLVTAVTSFVIVDTREDAPRAQKPAQFVEVPLAARPRAASLTCNLTADSSSMIALGFCRAHESMAMPTSRARTRSPLDILEWQNADGSFEPSNALCELLESLGVQVELLDELREIAQRSKEKATVEITRWILNWAFTLDADDHAALAESLKKAREWLDGRSEAMRG